MSDGEWVWFDNGHGRQVMRFVKPPPPDASSLLPRPYIISDGCEVRSMVDGKTYTSKAGLRQSYRENGYIEVGNEWINKDYTPPRARPDEAEIRQSLEKAFDAVDVK